MIDRWSVSANLAWQLDFWGQFRRAIEAAGANLDAQVAGYDEAVITLLAAVASNYVEIRTDQKRIAVLDENVKLEKEVLRVVKNRFENGRASELDYEQAATTMESVAAQIPPVREDLRQTNARLCVLLGIPPEDLVRCLGAGPIPSAPSEVAIGIPCQLLTRRPNVRQAERLAAQQSAEIGVAISAAYPLVSISGNFGWQSNELKTLFTPAGFNGSIGPSFQWNILNYGRILNNDRAQQASFQALVAAYQQTVLQAQADVETGLAAFLESQEQTKILQRSVTDAQKAVNVAWNQYQAGRTDMTTVATVALTLVQQAEPVGHSAGQHRPRADHDLPGPRWRLGDSLSASGQRAPRSPGTPARDSQAGDGIAGERGHPQGSSPRTLASRGRFGRLELNPSHEGNTIPCLPGFPRPMQNPLWTSVAMSE